MLKTDGEATADNLLGTIASRWRQVKRCIETGWCCFVVFGLCCLACLTISMLVLLPHSINPFKFNTEAVGQMAW